MNSTEAASKNGRSFTKNADVPAAPAAKRNGSSGKQQLDAKTTLPSAARLAAMVRFERALFSLASLRSLNILSFVAHKKPILRLVHAPGLLLVTATTGQQAAFPCS